jgi:2,4-dienoyl-CoA reductase-like NADH-dependent reductase (Old Yellow Enzyme family)
MHENIAILNQSLKLPCGVEIPNRLAKAAMSEQLANLKNSPTSGLVHLYKEWALGGAGLIITGNVMIKRTALITARDVVIEDERDLLILSKWADAGKAAGGQIWMQINHPGRQSPRFLSPQPIAPSSISIHVVKKAFAQPRALTEKEIQNLVQDYALTAAIAKKAGFTGVQIHAAHGYLISQFLSPLTNQRYDSWGGTPKKRMRFLLEIFRTTRNSVGQNFPISVKLNSADFQRGGFSEEESMQVVQALEAEGVDLIEVSGGSYEKLAMVGVESFSQKESTRQREAYFLEYACKVRNLVSTPIMLTGGFRTSRAMISAVAEGSVDMIGLGRPLAVEPYLPRIILKEESTHYMLKPLRTKIFTKNQLGFIELFWYTQQIQRIASGKKPSHNRTPLMALFIALLATWSDNCYRKLAR